MHLNRYDPIAFPSLTRTDYRITNSVEKVLFGKRTMPTPEEVGYEDNVTRLAAQLRGYTTVVALSRPAIVAVHKSVGGATYCHIVHPGMRGLNMLFRNSDLSGDRAARVEERCRRYAEQLIRSRV